MEQTTQRKLGKEVHSKSKTWDAWGTQQVECLSLDFGSGHDLKVKGSSPVSGSAQSMQPVWDSFPSSAFPPLPLALSLKQLKKTLLFGIAEWTKEI